LECGAPVVCGSHFGKIRAMTDDIGKPIEKALPGVPVEIMGLEGVPSAGDMLNVVADEKQGRLISEHRAEKQREEELAKVSKITLADLHKQIQEQKIKELRLVVKADVHGSIEVLVDQIKKFESDKIRSKIIHSGVGGITESDVLLSAASGAIIIGFNVRPIAGAKELAEKELIEIKLYNIIYDAVKDIKAAFEGLLEPIIKEVEIGKAQVKQLFKVPQIGTIAGSLVTEGKIVRNAIARVVRDSVVVYQGRISSLKRFKDDAREVAKGLECGIGIENYNDLKADDVIEVFKKEAVADTL
jgi:translation initiation factor IF-2